MKKFRMPMPSLRANTQSTGFNATNGGGTTASSTMLDVDTNSRTIGTLGGAA